MKRYAVVKEIGDVSTSVVREFDEPQDAFAFKDLLVRSEVKDFIKYYAVENLSLDPPGSLYDLQA